MKIRNGQICVAATLLGLVGLAGSGAQAQGERPSQSAPVAPSPTQLKRDALNRMMRQIPDVSFQDHRLEDVMKFIAEITGAEIEPLWIDDQRVEGLDKDTLITLSVRRVSALKLLEMVLEKAQGEASAYSGGNTWQMTDWGAIECGPKEQLSRHMRLEVYPINDLLWEIPNYSEAPNIDLQSVLQSSQGGGGGQSPFQDNQDQNVDRRTLVERADDLMDIIQSLVEPEQWLTGGGTSSIRYFQGNLLVRAPDFVHRQLGGYPWWPSSQTSARVVEGRRYVSIGVDTGISTVDDIVNQPVTGVVGGGGAGRPGGGG